MDNQPNDNDGNATEFKTLKDARSAYVELEAGAKASQEIAAEKIAQLEASVMTASKELTQAKADLEELREVATARAEELEAELEDAKSKAVEAEAHAADVVASTGIDPVPFDAEEADEQSHTEKLSAMSGVEKSQYFADHKAEIMREADEARRQKK
jgi:hypothetical protein